MTQMRQRSTFPPHLKPSQATFCSTVRQVLQAGINAEDILLSKASQSLHSSVLKPGNSHSVFRGDRICDPLRKKHASISCIKWTCPPKFILPGDWLLAVGDQSKERRVQEQRVSGVIEVIYSHPSAIPSSPSISLDVEEGHHDDGHNPPIIPLTPIEEDDEADSSHKVEPPSSIKENVNVEVLDQGVPTSHLRPHVSQRDVSGAAPKPGDGCKDALGILTGLEADIGAAASAAFTALVKSNEQGSLIDTDLLIKILRDPKMMEQLKDARSVGNEKATVQHEVKQENSYVIQPALDRQSALNLHNLLNPTSRDPAKEGSIKLPTKMQLTSEMCTIPSVPPSCSVPDTTTLLRRVCGNDDTLLKQSQTVSDFMEFISSTMLVPKSERGALSQKLENLIHDSVPVPNRVAPSVPISRFSTSTQPQPSCFSMAASPGSSAYKSYLSGKTTQSILDANYYKSLVRQHGVERQELQVQKHNPGQFENRLILREPVNLSAHLHRQGHGTLKASSPKRCIYFNKPKGCRLGLSCPYRHELSSPQMRARSVAEAPSGKRVKLNREIHQR